jgi:hypothetical protein
VELERNEQVDPAEPDDVDDEDDDLADPEEVEAELAQSSSDDDDGGSEDASLEELLAQRAARRPADEPEDPDDIMTLSSEAKTPIKEPLPSRVIPIRDREEFVCNRCHLVKRKSQLADPERMLCRDCV